VLAGVYTIPIKPDTWLTEEKYMIDDFDQPNTFPGTCPDCGQKANIWNATQQEWECSFCDWKGRNPKREIKSNEHTN